MCENIAIKTYISLEDFAHDVYATDHVARVEAINMTLDSKIQWFILVTARVWDGLAMCSILIGETWKLFANDEPHHTENADLARKLVKAYLYGAGFTVYPGVWNPRAVMDNIIHASNDLWHFEDKRLVPNDLATGTALAGDDQPPGGQPGDTNEPEE